MKDATLCYIFEEGKVLLQKKALGFGKGKWNGPGGKIERFETPEKAVVREVREETGLEVNRMEKVGLLNFREESGNAFSVHVFVAEGFSGTPRESEEGRLEWFPVDSLPYEEMWEDDRIWLPKALKKESFRGDFVFTAGFKKLVEYRMSGL